MHKIKVTSMALFISLIMALAAFPSAVSAATPQPSGNTTGLTAKIVAKSEETISYPVDATGYDVGIYIGPGAKNVKVTGAEISGANQEGILVQDTSNIKITNSWIHDNGTAPTGPERKAIELVGTTNCLIQGNIVENNKGDGGIGLADDGPVNPTAPNVVTAVPIASSGNLITGNLVQDNLVGCGIVMSAWNPGAGLAHNIVSNNILIGGVGGIIVAADLPFTTATDNVVINNTVSGSEIMGIIVHSNAPGDVVSGTKIIGNTLSNDGNEGPPYDPFLPTGIAVVAQVPGGPNPSVISETQVLSNTISNETYGVWVYNAEKTHIANLNTDSTVTTPIIIQ